MRLTERDGRPYDAAAEAHISERYLKDGSVEHMFDLVIDNSGTLESSCEEVVCALEDRGYLNCDTDLFRM